LTADVDPGLGHDSNRHWIDPRRIYSGACGVELMAGKRAQQAFGHLAAARVAGA